MSSIEEAAAAHQVIGRLQLTVNHYEARLEQLEQALATLTAEHEKSKAKPAKKAAKKTVPTRGVLTTPLEGEADK